MAGLDCARWIGFSCGLLITEEYSGYSITTGAGMDSAGRLGSGPYDKRRRRAQRLGLEMKINRMWKNGSERGKHGYTL